MTIYTDADYIFALLSLNEQKLYNVGKKVSWCEITLDILHHRDNLADFYFEIEDENSVLVKNKAYQDILKTTAEQVKNWLEDNLHIITVLDDDFPQQLLDIQEVPPYLFYEGVLKENDLGMSIIGARECSSEGEKVAKVASGILEKYGLTEIGGLAMGIDTIGHNFALNNKMRTVGFLPSGIRNLPNNQAEILLPQIVKNGGCVFSQFKPYSAPFMKGVATNTYYLRNALMSGYGICSIVIEAGEYSGTKHQVGRAINHGRPVILTNLVYDNTQWGKEFVSKYKSITVVSSISEMDEKVKELLSIETSRSAKINLSGLVMT
ncbi:MAG: DNA-protecting protein DprA [Candidatus Ancillula sp.]|jgi:DNA processing protein|nr:DNA-protecting protein DprA [Candidatus Ancillula sp.]